MLVTVWEYFLSVYGLCLRVVLEILDTWHSTIGEDIIVIYFMIPRCNIYELER